MAEFSNPPLRIGDELIYYYGCSSWGKNQPRPYRVSGGGIFRRPLTSGWIRFQSTEGRSRPDG